MLVLSRKATERVNIGDSIVVTVLQITGNKVRLGIAAPREVHIVRAELENVIADATTNLVAVVIPAS